MKSIIQVTKHCGLLLLTLVFAACSPQTQPEKLAAKSNSSSSDVPTVDRSQTGLPVQYQTPTYMVDIDSSKAMEEDEEEGLKVGANIVSTRGPEPLGDVLRILASSKGFTISWASDVDRNVLVDVNIGAKDDFHKSIENLLRQVDYFHEFEDNTIIVKYKETRQFHIAMPFTAQNYRTGTGGNVLGGGDNGANVDGTIELRSDNNEFDIWKNIQANMDAIISTWNTTTVQGSTGSTETEDADGEESDAGDEEGGEETVQAAMQVSSGDSMYIIDKPVGLITVSAPRPVLERLEDYFNSLKRELYKQVSIEAKIIEVKLTDNSKIGIDWSQVLNNFPLRGSIDFGESVDGGWSNLMWPNDNALPFVRSVWLDSANFSMFLSALKTQGDTHVLSSPRLSVMNGQPALISVGRNTTYVDSIEADRDTDTGVITYTINTERIMSGIGMALTANVLDDKEIIMNLVPVTSELEEPIEYRSVGAGEVGLPVVNVREMSTTVKVKDGEMLVIGGLIDNTSDTKGEFAPIAGSIPIVRYLFGHEKKIREKRELIILLKPTIL
ncbi:MAG: pilus (MSHA type) biogenesis protein MshL [Deltaproteobacteria bacterium]|nr:MAG: pilus (MSHA type) biogenesis protein MshL [Deltaproteobacteria bacterium]